MSLVCLTGVPGSGKTYRLAHTVVKILNTSDDIVILDIQLPLKITHPRLFYVPDATNSSFYTESFFVPFLAECRSDFPNAKAYLFIDEAQRHFPYYFKNPDVHYFFDTHRHHKLDIYLVTQSITKIDKHIVTNVEFEVRATSPTFRMFQSVPLVHRYLDRFTYRKIIAGSVVSVDKLRPDPEIFALYSTINETVEVEKKVKSFGFLKIMLIVSIIFIPFFMYLFNTYFLKQGRIESPPISSSDSLPLQAPNSRLLQGSRLTSDDNFVKYSSPGEEITFSNSATTDTLLPLKFFSDYPGSFFGYSFFSGRKSFLAVPSTSTQTTTNNNSGSRP